MPAEMSMKRCTKCKDKHPRTTEFFARRPSVKDGLDYTCKQCRLNYRRDNRQRLAEYKRRYDQKHRPQNREYHRDYQARKVLQKHVPALPLPAGVQPCCQLTRWIRNMVYGDALQSGVWRLERQCFEQICPDENDNAPDKSLVKGSYCEYSLFSAARLYGVFEIRACDVDHIHADIERLAKWLIQRGWIVTDTRLLPGGARTDPDLNITRIKRLLKQTA